MSIRLKGPSGLALVLSGGMLLSACEGSTSHRVASVGDSGVAAAAGSGGDDIGTGGTGGGASGGSGGGSDSNQGGQSAMGGRVLVTAGNLVLGVAEKHDGVAGKTTELVPASQRVTGKVTRILTATGQSLVDIGNGRTVLIGGANNAVGRLVSLGIANRQLIGVSSGQSLVGVNLLTRTPASGTLATASLLTSGKLTVVDVNKPGAAGKLGGLSPSNGTMVPTGITGKATGTLSGTKTGANGAVSKLLKVKR